MTKKMLIDAAHPEETRVVVVDGTRVEEFDFESQNRKQLRGNIYLAKVTRVEPSLQAAFVDFGGNRHGFLAFSEIHPDYYQIPSEDRARLLAEEQAAADEEAALRAEEEDDEDSYPGDEDDDPRLAPLAQTVAVEDVQLWYQIAVLGRRDLPYAPDPRLGFEMTVLRMFALPPEIQALVKAGKK